MGTDGSNSRASALAGAGSDQDETHGDIATQALRVRAGLVRGVYWAATILAERIDGDELLTQRIGLSGP